MNLANKKVLNLIRKMLKLWVMCEWMEYMRRVQEMSNVKWKKNIKWVQEIKKCDTNMESGEVEYSRV